MQVRRGWSGEDILLLLMIIGAGILVGISISSTNANTKKIQARAKMVMEGSIPLTVTSLEVTKKQVRVTLTDPLWTGDSIELVQTTGHTGWERVAALRPRGVVRIKANDSQSADATLVYEDNRFPVTVLDEPPTQP